jgi:hypothetical protein
VQVIFDPVARRAVSVLHYAHGIEFRFDLAEATECQTIESDVLELRGRYDPTLDLVNKRWQRREDQITRAQNNVVRMYRDPTTGAFTHPVVYISTEVTSSSRPTRGATTPRPARRRSRYVI